MFKDGPITIDAREMPHFFSCAAEIFLVLVGAKVSTVAITLHQLEYMVLHTENGCQTHTHPKKKKKKNTIKK